MTQRDDSTTSQTAPVAAAPGVSLGRLGRQLFFARLALFWERLWPALWPAVGLGGAFLMLALFDFLPYLPVWLHSLVLAAFIAGIGYALWRATKAVFLPEMASARRRIETSSGLMHRPLLMLRDRLATGSKDPESRTLWQLHRLRTIQKIRGLRVGLPSPGLARYDQLALRGALLVLLVVGLTVAWGDGFNRVARALVPGAGGPAKGPAVVDVWITPPAYTGIAPILLSAGKPEPSKAPLLVSAGTAGVKPAPRAPKGKAPGPVLIPEGSTVLAQLSGGWGTPRLILGTRDEKFGDVADGTYKLAGKIGFEEDADALVIRQGANRIARWQVRIIPDESPEIRFSDEPGTSARGALKVEFEGDDDYGIAKAKLYVRRARVTAKTGKEDGEEEALATMNAAVALDLPLPGASAKKIEETSYHDLTAHPWAGLEVSLQVLAEDAAGQPGASEPATLTLPERYFRHPVARAIVLLRKRLTFDPDSRDDVIDSLINLSTIPGSFDDDTVVFLALQSVAHSLRWQPGLAAISEAQSVLWDTALRLEDGKLSQAERRMREIQKKLLEAMRNKASNPEIEKLMRELQKAMSEFLREMMKGLKNLPRMARPFDPNQRFLSQNDLQRLLDRARELAKTGNMAAARQLLNMLREMLENLRSGKFAQGRGGRRGDSKAWEMLRNLQELLRGQQKLMDDTFRNSQRGQPGEKAPGSQQGSKRQDGLRGRLGEILRKFGEMMGKVPRSLGEAELAMRESLEALRKNRPGKSLGPQGRAIEQLQQGAGEMVQQLMRRLGRGQGRGRGRGLARRQGRFNMTHDPLGRPLPNSGLSASDDVDIPDEADTQRAREILEELRRRAGEVGRPTAEMDYIERLLKRF